MSERTSATDKTASGSFPDAPNVTISPPPLPDHITTANTPADVSRPNPTSTAAPTRSHVHYGPISVDTRVPAMAASQLSPLSPTPGVTRSDTELSRIDLRRRNTRANTFKTINEFDEPGWHPGSEPGVDTSKPDGGHASMSQLHAECQITIVDFSQDDLAIHELENAQMIEFLKVPKPAWVKCRWINVNGLSWDVIQALGEHKKLHRLAIEDIMNTKNRTKADWYSSHAFLVLTCQKLVRMIDPDDSSSDEEDDQDTHNFKSYSFFKGCKRDVKRWYKEKRREKMGIPTSVIIENGQSTGPFKMIDNNLHHQATGLSEIFNPNTLCTLQRYQAGSNDARTDYMERHSALAPRGLAVMAEQVAMFLCADNTVIAFFEQSADDVEKPILARLGSPDTILRQSCDASMVGQAIIDAIIDMAIPIAACYSDVVGDLELDVLTQPNLKHTKNLYIIISEINKMFSFVNPIASLIQALRDHKTPLDQDRATQELQNAAGGVIITPMTAIYLGDVYDHCLLITESLNQIKESANGMIDLIFNTLSSMQNDSMKQLTIVTIFFLPMTFITGYFGQNFEPFPELDRGISFFWTIAAPVAVATILILMRDTLMEMVARFFQKRRIDSVRKKRKERADRARTHRRMRKI